MSHTTKIQKILTCDHKTNGFIDDVGATLANRVKVLNDMNVGYKVDHILLSTTIGLSHQVPQILE